MNGLFVQHCHCMQQAMVLDGANTGWQGMTSTISWWYVSSWKITTLIVNTHKYKSYRFSCTFHENSKAAGGGASLVFSHTLVHAAVLWEHFGDHQSVGTAVVLVTEVLTIIDLFSTLEPLEIMLTITGLFSLLPYSYLCKPAFDEWFRTPVQQCFFALNIYSH